MTVITESESYLDLHVPPEEMVKYILDLMTLPHAEIAPSSAQRLARPPRSYASAKVQWLPDSRHWVEFTVVGSPFGARIKWILKTSWPPTKANST